MRGNRLTDRRGRTRSDGSSLTLTRANSHVCCTVQVWAANAQSLAGASEELAANKTQVAAAAEQTSTETRRDVGRPAKQLPARPGEDVITDTGASIGDHARAWGCSRRDVSV
jgi:hypothetical protein